MKNKAIAAVSGVKNSGKTTLMEKLIRVLTGRGLQVAAVKHDGHDFTPDVPGNRLLAVRPGGGLRLRHLLPLALSAGAADSRRVRAGLFSGFSRGGCDLAGGI